MLLDETKKEELNNKHLHHLKEEFKEISGIVNDNDTNTLLKENSSEIKHIQLHVQHEIDENLILVHKLKNNLNQYQLDIHQLKENVINIMIYWLH